MKRKRSGLPVFCFAITIINLIASFFLLFNQINQLDYIFDTVIQIVILVIIIFLGTFVKMKRMKMKRKFLLVYLFLLILLLFQTTSTYFNNKITIIGKENPTNFETVYFSYNNYEYYSNNSYVDVIIKVGNKRYTFYQLSNIRKDKINFLIKYFHLKKRSKRENIVVKLSNQNNIIYVKSDGLGVEYYYNGIEDVILYADHKVYHYKDNNYPLSLKQNTSLRDIDNNFNAYYEGEYYNIVECFYREQGLAKAYVIPVSMKMDSMERFCNNK